MSDSIGFPWLRRIRLSFSGMSGGRTSTMEATGKITDYHITATIHKEIMGLPPSTEIIIRNLSPDTRKAFVKNETKVRIEAGWDFGPFAGLRECFVGELLSSESYRRGPTIETKIAAMSGLNGLSKAHAEKTYPSIPVRNVIFDLASKIEGVTYDASLVKGIKGKIGERGWSCCEDVKDALTKLAREFSFSWTIIDGKFHAIGDKEAFGVTATLEDPYLINVNPMLSGPQRVVTGVKFSSTYTPGVKPMYYTRIKSTVDNSNDGEYRVNVARHFLDCYADNGFQTHGMAHILGKR